MSANQWQLAEEKSRENFFTWADTITLYNVKNHKRKDIFPDSIFSALSPIEGNQKKDFLVSIFNQIRTQGGQLRSPDGTSVPGGAGPSSKARPEEKLTVNKLNTQYYPGPSLWITR